MSDELAIEIKQLVVCLYKIKRILENTPKIKFFIRVGYYLIKIALVFFEKIK